MQEYLLFIDADVRIECESAGEIPGIQSFLKKYEEILHFPYGILVELEFFLPSRLDG
ncbi:hypothetical protein J15TS10_23880 [Paenibacillus woosongensis]|uniref:Uncharacterized protein n=1 Tax=Paenibacillus woosongensis TaxID=307580 RepID=A0ABQ4MRL8_9BACL|nr:hypothetical protein J15TS10_23880 [Paenibacillus woosongensis]